MTAPRLTLELTLPEVQKLLSYLGMAQIHNAELIERICLQTGEPIPAVTRQWLADRRAGRR